MYSFLNHTGHQYVVDAILSCECMQDAPLDKAGLWALKLFRILCSSNEENQLHPLYAEAFGKLLDHSNPDGMLKSMLTTSFVVEIGDKADESADLHLGRLISSCGPLELTQLIKCTTRLARSSSTHTIKAILNNARLSNHHDDVLTEFYRSAVFGIYDGGTEAVKTAIDTLDAETVENHARWIIEYVMGRNASFSGALTAVISVVGEDRLLPPAFIDRFPDDLLSDLYANMSLHDVDWQSFPRSLDKFLNCFGKYIQAFGVDIADAKLLTMMRKTGRGDIATAAIIKGTKKERVPAESCHEIWLAGIDAGLGSEALFKIAPKLDPIKAAEVLKISQELAPKEPKEFFRFYPKAKTRHLADDLGL